MLFAMINIALARAALEEHRNRQQLLALLDGAQQARRRNFSDVPFAVQILVMALAGRDKIGINVELVAFDADFAVDNRLAARVIGETEGNFWFCWPSVCPSMFLPANSSSRFQISKSYGIPNDWNCLNDLNHRASARRERSPDSGCRSAGIVFLYRKYPACARLGLPETGSRGI